MTEQILNELLVLQELAKTLRFYSCLPNYRKNHASVWYAVSLSQSSESYDDSGVNSALGRRRLSPSICWNYSSTFSIFSCESSG